jgi:hypothetical protein
VYVALLNGYPYGAFHGLPVKAEVFAPDWRDQRRLSYTLDLARILAQLLPEDMDGGISTVPLGYKPWGMDAGGWSAIVRNVVQACEALVTLRDTTGRSMHLDIEPEPDGLVETAAETIAFFHHRLLPEGAPLLAHSLGIDVSSAERLLLEHVAVCLDTCHFSVEYEDCAQAAAVFGRAGVRLGRVQISAALRVQVDGVAPAELRSLAEPVYLHQVIERRADGTLRRYRDLPEALRCGPGSGAREWRVHFHVPLFAPRFGELASTNEDILPLLASPPGTSHLEIETYTWSVLPEALRIGLVDSIEREYRWVLESLCTKQSS